MSASVLSSLSSTSTDVTFSKDKATEQQSKDKVDEISGSEVVEIVPPAASGGKRRMGGWASDLTVDNKGKKLISTEEEDERLKQNVSHDDIPVIPDLEEILEEDLTTQMAAPPSVSVTRVATYNQLNTDLSRHAGLFTLDGDIDLKLLAEYLTPEADVIEEDKCWEWDKLFAELSPDIQAIWDQLALKGEGGKSVSMETGIQLPAGDLQ